MSNNANHFRGWQLVEEDIYEGWTSGNPGAVDERRTHVRGFWGARYIDDLMQTLVDGNADGDYVDTSGDDQYFFFLADAQFSVTAVLDGNANLQERVVYDAYGEANHHDWRDTDGDGDYDATDRSTINTLASASPSGTPITNASYEPDADLDRDGDVDSTDLSLGGTTYPTPLNKGELSLAAVGNRFGYDGYRFNPETEQYTVRNRHYDPILGRWLERDPAGYVDGGNLYQYAGGAPLTCTDGLGLKCTLVAGPSVPKGDIDLGDMLLEGTPYRALADKQQHFYQRMYDPAFITVPQFEHVGRFQLQNKAWHSVPGKAFRRSGVLFYITWDVRCPQDCVVELEEEVITKYRGHRPVTASVARQRHPHVRTAKWRREWLRPGWPADTTKIITADAPSVVSYTERLAIPGWPDLMGPVTHTVKQRLYLRDTHNGEYVSITTFEITLNVPKDGSWLD